VTDPIILQKQLYCQTCETETGHVVEKGGLFCIDCGRRYAVNETPDGTSAEKYIAAISAMNRALNAENARLKKLLSAITDAAMAFVHTAACRSKTDATFPGKTEVENILAACRDAGRSETITVERAAKLIEAGLGGNWNKRDYAYVENVIRDVVFERDAEIARLSAEMEKLLSDITDAAMAFVHSAACRSKTDATFPGKTEVENILAACKNVIDGCAGGEEKT
jgi:hypothetical protein